MELHLKQWRDQQQGSEQAGSAKIPKLFLEPHQLQQQLQPSGLSAFPLFVPESISRVNSMSASPDSNNRSFRRMGSYFSLAQWQELELQALIYRYILAGAAVPPELLQPIKKGLLNSTPYLLHHPLQHYPHYQPALLQSGYWGRAAVDPEPGRCKRTDGKKWRCSRDVVGGHKYCERHMHRGRNRSRKHMELPTPTSAAATPIPIFCGGSGNGLTASGTVKTTNTITTCSSPLAEMANGSGFGLSGPSASINLLHFNHSSSAGSENAENNGLFDHQNQVDNRNDGHILRHFFDDWPRSIQETNNNAETHTTTINSATCLSISMLGNSLSSDISLKLSTGNGEEMGSRGVEREQPLPNWATGWTAKQVASMGGPLAEALRSSTSNSSPTSVLHQLARGSASETSYVSA